MAHRSNVHWWAAVFALVVAAHGCGDSDELDGEPVLILADGLSAADGLLDGAGGTDEAGGDDGTGAEKDSVNQEDGPQQPDATSDDVGAAEDADAAQQETGPACPGAIGCPCDKDADCPPASGCGDTADGKRCLSPCLSGVPCAPGHACTLLPGDGSAGTDPKPLCVSKWATSCDPCTTSASCVTVGSGGAACVAAGDPPGAAGWFCGVPCKSADACPPGFGCVEVATAESGVGSYCQPASGECTCSVTAKAAKLGTSCASTGVGPDGKPVAGCKGVRGCGSAGLAACSAPVTSDETCDGFDNDCDGATDEPPVGKPMCDDGKPCTTDACQGGACVYLPNGDACDDGSKCTGDDACLSGNCTGTAILCNDTNPCTSDSCDPVQGCVYTPNTAPCDDGDACTAPDTCAAGKCVAGPVVCTCQQDADCAAKEDGNACNGKLFCDKAKAPFTCQVAAATLVKCDPAGDTTCVVSQCDPTDGKCKPLAQNEGKACEDGSACSVGDLCKAGTCVAGVVTQGGCPANHACGTGATGQVTCTPCPAGHELKANACVDVNECTKPGACAVEATCQNTAGSFTCTCKAGYTGDGKKCADVDECATAKHDCAPQATCGNTPGGFTCTCAGGTVGDGKTCAKKGSSATAPAVSCFEALTLYPGSGDGAYWLDFDGAGPSPTAQYACDMKGGGWTRLFADDFENGQPSGWSSGSVTKCGDWSHVLGGQNVFGKGAATTKTVAITPPHTLAQFWMNYLRIDSWDGEKGIVQIDGAQVWSKTGNLATFKWECGGTVWSDDKWDAAWQGGHSAKAIAMTATSTLDSKSSNESFAIDNVQLWVK